MRRRTNGITRGVPQPDAAQVVFLVDDDSSVRQSLARPLEERGFRVLIFTQPEAFLNHHAAHPAQLVVLDIWMQLTTGIDLLAYLYACSPETRTIFITGPEDHAAEASLISAGAFALFSKPLNHEEFLDAVHCAFAKAGDPVDEEAAISFY